MNEADQIIDRCRSLAEQLSSGENNYLNLYASFLETKLREVLYRAPGLAVYDSMLPAKAAAMNRVGEVTP